MNWTPSAHLAALVLAIGLAGGSAAQDLYQPSKEEPPQRQEKRPVTPSLPSCALVIVSPGPVRADGLKWDLGKSTEAPDIIIKELSTGAEAKCAQTWSCSLTLVPTGTQLSLKLSDEDIDADDPIGQGSCSIGKTCQIGVAKVSVKRC